MQENSNNTSSITVDSHIEITPGTCGGKPRIAGHRIRVEDIVIWHERMGLSAEEIVRRYPQLKLSEIYAALAYYYDHREQIDAQMDEDEKSIEQMRNSYPSKLKSKLSSEE